MKIFSNAIDHKHILRMALPAIAGVSTQMVVSLVDTALVGRLDDAVDYLAAMGLGVLATWAVISFFSSLATGTHILIARRYGAKNYEGCSEVLNTSLIISFIIGCLVSFLVVYFAFDIARFFAVDKVGPKVPYYAGQFLFYRFLGIPFFLLTVSYRGFFFGIGKTKIFLYSGIMVNLLNIIFNYLLIYGAFGFKGMGLAGSGLGSTLATICDALYYFTVTCTASYRIKYSIFKTFRFVKDIARSILKLSLPVSLQNVFLMLGFLGFIAVTGYISKEAQAASQTIIAAIQIVIMPCFGFGIAIQTLTGNSLGSGNIRQAKMYGYETSKIATIYTLIVGIVFMAFPEGILWLTTNDQNIIKDAMPALRIVGFGQIFYSTGIVLANGLQSAGKTVFVMGAEVIANWFVFVPLAYVFGVICNFGLEGAWASLPFYAITYTTIILFKFKFGSWKQVQAF
jgi:putative MATE family efflux protein